MKDTRTNNTSYIAEGTTLKANMTSEGNIHISGIVDGEIITKQHLILNDTGKITGNTIANTAMISGYIEGDLRVTETLKIHANAKINGNIFAKHLVTEEGAEINGILRTGKDVKVLAEQIIKEVPLQKKAG